MKAKSVKDLNAVVYYRLDGMQQRINELNDRLDIIDDNLGLLIALEISTDEQRARLVSEIKKGASAAAEESKESQGGADGSYVAQGN